MNRAGDFKSPAAMNRAGDCKSPAALSRWPIRFRVAAVLAAALIAPPAARADVLPVSSAEFGFRRAAFLARGMAARPVGMGEAFTAVADDASAISWNPGGLGLCRNPEGLVQYDDAGNGLRLVYGAVAFPVAGQILGVSITSLNYGPWEMRDAAGVLTGKKEARDLAGSFGIAAANPEFLRGYTGVAIERVDEAAGAGGLWGISAGSLVPVAPGLRAGVAALHLGAKKDGFGLPATVRAGVSWLMSPRLRLSFEGGYGLTDRVPRASLGAELRPVRAVALRLGYGYRGRDQSALGGLSGFGAGAGVRAGPLGLDYAYQPFGDLGVSHRFAFVYAMGPSAAQRQEAEFEEAHALALSTLGPKRKGATMISAELERNATEAFRDANAALSSGDFGRAVSKATDAIKLNPFYWEAWETKGNALEAQGDVHGAITAYKKSLELHPENPALRERLIRITPPAAPKAPAPAPAAKPAPPNVPAGGAVPPPPPAAQSAKPAVPAASVTDAIAAYTVGDVDGAWRKAAAVLEADRTNWQAWQVVGNCQLAKGDKAGALVSYRESLRLNPGNAELKAYVESLSK